MGVNKTNKKPQVFRIRSLGKTSQQDEVVNTESHFIRRICFWNHSSGKGNSFRNLGYRPIGSDYLTGVANDFGKTGKRSSMNAQLKEEKSSTPIIASVVLARTQNPATRGSVTNAMDEIHSPHKAPLCCCRSVVPPPHHLSTGAVESNLSQGSKLICEELAILDLHCEGTPLFGECGSSSLHQVVFFVHEARKCERTESDHLSFRSSSWALTGSTVMQYSARGGHVAGKVLQRAREYNKENTTSPP
ncbi:hypothetical protein Anapl_05968 [Anas platyrhynchos]|uniref:Uncharacterized protein n=1 Tax=Anas platyrhynchos TaxID=8839 RepID=R0LZ95_ANAPL|nr:hypothetical protein Anapl_05968 [Anas platyrhynchos]